MTDAFRFWEKFTQPSVTIEFEDVYAQRMIRAIKRGDYLIPGGPDAWVFWLDEVPGTRPNRPWQTRVELRAVRRQTSESADTPSASAKADR